MARNTLDDLLLPPARPDQLPPFDDAFTVVDREGVGPVLVWGSSEVVRAFARGTVVYVQYSGAQYEYAFVKRNEGWCLIPVHMTSSLLSIPLDDMRWRAGAAHIHGPFETIEQAYTICVLLRGDVKLR